MHDKLNALSKRGTRRGFDHVLAAASESAARDAVERDGANDDLDPIPFAITDPVVARRRRPVGSMIAAAGIAALLIVGTFAVTAMVGSGGGSGSAEGAVRQLADAISHEDPIAAADVLAPDEVRSLDGTLDAAEKKAAELQLVQTAGAPLAGIDLNVAGLNLSTESLGDGYTKVIVEGGTISAATKKANFSAVMQKVLRNTDDNSSSADLVKAASGLDLPTFVVAVREGGHWYVSVAYTVLEYVREYNQVPAADLGSGNRDIAKLGAATPDAAVQDAMHALQSNDWSKLMTLAPPDEIPVYDYRAALNALIAKSDGGADQSHFTIATMTTTSQVSGDTAKVTLKASGATSDSNWSLDGGCFKVNATPDRSAESLCGDSSPFELSPLRSIFGAIDSSTQITTVQHDGRWFVSPVGTVLDVVDRLISQLDRRTVYSALNIPTEIPADGTLTLGKAVELNASNQDLQVLTFAGHKHEQLLGLPAANKNAKPSVPVYADAQARVFTPTGEEIDNAAGMLHGQPLTLPVDGTYRVILQGYGQDLNVTIWDVANAPAAAKVNPGGDSCTYTARGETCSSSSFAGSSSGSSSGSLGPAPTASSSGETCTSTANSIACSSTATTAPGADVKQSGTNGGGVIIGNGIAASVTTSTAP